MGKVTVKTGNIGSIVKRCENVFWQNAMPIVAEQQLTDCNEYVRYQDGILAASATTEKGGKEIHWTTAYAKRVYYTGTPRRNRNPNASLRWCEVARRHYSREWATMATKLVKGG